MAYKLIQGYRIRDPLITETLDNFDFYIMPVVNPDGKLIHIKAVRELMLTFLTL